MPPELERGFGGRGNRAGPQNGQTAAAPGSAPPAPAAGATPPAAVSSEGRQPGSPRPAGMATAGQVEAKTQASQERQSGENRPAGANAQGDGRNAGGGGQGQGGRGGFANMTPEERQKRMEERMASMTPEEKAAFQARMKERMAQGGGRGGFGGGQGGNAPSSQRGAGQAAGNVQRGDAAQSARPRQQTPQANNSKSVATTSATTIDSLFAPLPVVETRQRAWLYINKQLKPVTLRLGISDGTYTEVLNDTELPPEAELVTSIVTAAQATTPANQQNNANGNPLMPQRGRPGGPGGGGGGRGGGR